jgi:hypothetical protein
MVVWALTAGIGIYLLAVGISAQRAAGLARARAAAEAAASQLPPGTAGGAPDGTGGPAPAVGTQALAVVLGGGQAPAAPPPEGSPLLEFTHPALALLGLTFWIFFVMTGYRLFAWIAFGVVVATVTAGLGWELSRRRTARQRAAARDGEAGGPGGAADGPRFPPHLVLAHGVAAACTFALVVIAAVVASHG